MASKIFTAIFTGASANPSAATGLTPTLIVFKRLDTNADLSAPAISEVNATGIYKFSYEATLPIAFIMDGTSSAPAGTRYVVGSLDPIQYVDQIATSLMAIGTSNFALGTSMYVGFQTLLAVGLTSGAIGLTLGVLIGTASSSIGSTSADPTDVMGHLKRAMEVREGNAVFTKTSGIWDIKSRGGTLLAQKTLSNAVTTVTKS